MARTRHDVVIVGGGLAGSALAANLSRRNVDVAVCDVHDTYPNDFRAEKLTSDQIETFRRLGLSTSVLRAATPIEDLWIARFGRIVERRRNREHGLDYAALIGAVRSELPGRYRITGRVAAVATSAHRQEMTLKDGTEIEARLLVVATGLGKGILTGLGIRRVDVHEDHRLAIGFDIVPHTAPAFRALTYYGEKVSDRSAYLTLFPIEDRLRANLFVYRRRDEDWSRAFQADPHKCLLAIMPGLQRLLPGFSVPQPPVLRPIHLYSSANYERDGVVVIGDAFSTTCPTGGTGIDKALTDVECLSEWIPRWLSTPGMEREKIVCFYDDPRKIASDLQARRMVHYARNLAINPNLAWRARRYRNFYLQRLRHWLRRSVRRHRLPPAQQIQTTGTDREMKLE